MVLRPSEGGAFGHAASLASGLAARGHEVAICGPHGDHREGLDVEVIELEIGRPIAPAADLGAVRRLGAVLREREPDLIHAHGSKGGVMARLARVARPRAPLVFTPHGYAFAGHFSSRAERTAYRITERLLAPLASRVLCVCGAEARLAAGVGSGTRVRVVHNGIEPPAQIAPDAELAARRAGGPVVSAITGLRAGKGNETLVSAFAAVVRAHPEATLVIAGDGSERAEVEAEVAAAGLGDRVLLPGEVSDVYAVLAASDLFVLPSWAESFPYSVLEAMALGLPIVATDVGGVSEAVEDGVTGLLVEPRSSAALERAMLSVLDDRARARALGAAAQERALARFTLSRMIEGTLAVYGELIDV